MKKYLLVLLVMACAAARGEWYRVDSVPAYNKIRAVKADGSSDPVVIRVRNLEKIEYIQPDPEKVLIGGKETISLAKLVLKGQVVWVENLQSEAGEFVADVYPSYTQVVEAFKRERIVNGDNVSQEIKGKIGIIYKQMLVDLNQSPLPTETSAQVQKANQDVRTAMSDLYARTLSQIRSATPKISTGKKSSDNEAATDAKQYDGTYRRAIYTADAIIWFRDKGQKMNPLAQQLFVDLLQDFQGQSGSDARYTQIKLKEIMQRQKFFGELFVNATDFERGQFTYNCLDWFKNRGQYLPASVQNIFVNWLRAYQQTHCGEDNFMKKRLQWMMDHNGLYQDFLDLDSAPASPRQN